MQITISSPQTPAAPAPPVPPTPPTPDVVSSSSQQIIGGVQVPGVPQTRAEVEALRERREELSDQLISATGRRNDLAEAIKGADAASRPGLVDRMQLLDRRILQLESDIAVTGQQLTAAPVNLKGGEQLTFSTAEPTMFGLLSSDQVTGISIVFTVVVLMPLAIGMARMMWKRATAPIRAALTQDAATTQRMERMEQGIESIAIEVERVSEAQRFLTRLLTEQRDGGLPALGIGQRPAEPVRVPQGEGVRVKAREG